MAGLSLSFGNANTSQNRFFWRGVYDAGTLYNLMDCVSFSGSAYVSLTTQTGVVPTNTLGWGQMTSGGSVTSVAGRVGTVVLTSADLGDKDSPGGVAGLDGNTFLKSSEFNLTLNAQVGSTYTFVAADRGKVVTFSNATGVAVTLPQATGSFASGWYCEVENIGAGIVTITPTTSTVDGAASITLAQFQSVTLLSNGTNYICLRSKSAIVPTTATTHQFVTAIAADGTATKAQPAFSDISGSVAAAQLPNPSASTLGGVESIAEVTSKWVNAISTSGVPSATQPASTDLSDVATLATLTGTQTLTSKTIDTASNTLLIGGINITTASASFSTALSADSGTITTGSATMRFKRIGKLVFVQVSVTITTAGTAVGRFAIVTLPFASAAVIQHLAGRETALTGKMLYGLISASSSTMLIGFYDNTASIANGNALEVNGVYEIA